MGELAARTAAHLHQADMTGSTDSATARIKNSWWNEGHPLAGLRAGFVDFSPGEQELTVTLSPVELTTTYLVIPRISIMIAGSDWYDVRVKAGSQVEGHFVLQMNVPIQGSDQVRVAWELWSA